MCVDTGTRRVAYLEIGMGFAVGCAVVEQYPYRYFVVQVPHLQYFKISTGVAQRIVDLVLGLLSRT